MSKTLTLAVFDMDGTLLISPGPRAGEEKGFWKNPKPLETRDAPVIASTLEALNRAKSEGATVLIMTGRRRTERMELAAAAALARAGVTGYARLILKPLEAGDTGEWKEGMILELAREHGATRVDLWDDRPEHAAAFRRTLQEAGLDGTVTEVEDPRWVWNGRGTRSMPKDS